MSTALRATFAVPLCALLLFAFSTAHAAPTDASGNSDGNLDCPSQSFYVYVKGVKYGETINGKVNLYGKRCVDYENRDRAAEGHCEGPKNCKADLCDGKPCALPKLKLDAVQQAVYGESVPVTPTPTLTPTTPSLLDRAWFDRTESSQQTDTIAPSANSVEELLKQTDAQPRGFVDDIRERIGGFFSPTPQNPAPESFQLQPRDENGQPLAPQEFGPENTITPGSTFNETKDQTTQTASTPACDSWRCSIASFFKLTETDGFSQDKTPTTVPHEPVGPTEYDRLDKSDLESGTGRSVCARRICSKQFTLSELESMKGQVFEGVRTSEYSEKEKTAYGGVNDPKAYTTASALFPNKARLLEYNPATGDAVVVSVNDTGPFVIERNGEKRYLDNTPQALRALNLGGLSNPDVSYVGQSGPTGYLGKYASIDEAISAYAVANNVAGITPLRSPGTQPVQVASLDGYVPQTTSSANPWGSNTSPVAYAAGLDFGSYEVPVSTLANAGAWAQPAPVEIASVEPDMPAPVLASYEPSTRGLSATQAEVPSPLEPSPLIPVTSGPDLAPPNPVVAVATGPELAQIDTTQLSDMERLQRGEITAAELDAKTKALRQDEAGPRPEPANAQPVTLTGLVTRWLAGEFQQPTPAPAALAEGEPAVVAANPDTGGNPASQPTRPDILAAPLFDERRQPAPETPVLASSQTVITPSSPAGQGEASSAPTYEELLRLGDAGLGKLTEAEATLATARDSRLLAKDIFGDGMTSNFVQETAVATAEKRRDEIQARYAEYVTYMNEGGPAPAWIQGAVETARKGEGLTSNRLGTFSAGASEAAAKAGEDFKAAGESGSTLGMVTGGFRWVGWTGLATLESGVRTGGELLGAPGFNPDETRAYRQAFDPKGEAIGAVWEVGVTTIPLLNPVGRATSLSNKGIDSLFESGSSGIVLREAGPLGTAGARVAGTEAVEGGAGGAVSGGVKAGTEAPYSTVAPWPSTPARDVFGNTAPSETGRLPFATNIPASSAELRPAAPALSPELERVNAASQALRDFVQNPMPAAEAPVAAESGSLRGALQGLEKSPFDTGASAAPSAEAQTVSRVTNDLNQIVRVASPEAPDLARQAQLESLVSAAERNTAPLSPFERFDITNTANALDRAGQPELAGRLRNIMSETAAEAPAVTPAVQSVERAAASSDIWAGAKPYAPESGGEGAWYSKPVAVVGVSALACGLFPCFQSETPQPPPPEQREVNLDATLVSESELANRYPNTNRAPEPAAASAPPVPPTLAVTAPPAQTLPAGFPTPPEPAPVDLTEIQPAAPPAAAPPVVTSQSGGGGVVPLATPDSNAPVPGAPGSPEYIAQRQKEVEEQFERQRKINEDAINAWDEAQRQRARQRQQEAEEAARNPLPLPVITPAPATGTGTGPSTEDIVTDLGGSGTGTGAGGGNTSPEVNFNAQYRVNSADLRNPADVVPLGNAMRRLYEQGYRFNLEGNTSPETPSARWQNDNYVLGLARARTLQHTIATFYGVPLDAITISSAGASRLIYNPSGGVNYDASRRVIITAVPPKK